MTDADRAHRKTWTTIYCMIINGKTVKQSNREK